MILCGKEEIDALVNACENGTPDAEIAGYHSGR